MKSNQQDLSLSLSLPQSILLLLLIPHLVILIRHYLDFLQLLLPFFLLFLRFLLLPIILKHGRFSENKKHVDDTGNAVEVFLDANGLSMTSDLESLVDPDPDIVELLNGVVCLLKSPIPQRMFRKAWGPSLNEAFFNRLFFHSIQKRLISIGSI